MLPILLDLGFIKIYTFGVFLVLAFFWGAFFLWKNVALTAYKEEEVFDGLFISLLGALLVGRVFYVALHFSDFGYDVLRFFLINGYPGLSIMGMITGFYLFLFFFSQFKKVSYMRLIDYVTAPLFLALAIAKLGSFFAGSEIGSQTSFFISLSYPNFDGMRHLTTLYESIFFFLGTYLTYKILREIRRGKYFEGFTFLFFIWYFALVSTVFDPLKAFHTSVQGISFDMIFAGVILLTASIYFIYYFRTSIWRFVTSFSKKK